MSSHISEDEIFYKLALHKYNHYKKGQRNKYLRLLEKYDIDPSNPREGLIRLGKTGLHPILPEEEEVIPRSEWDLEGLVGQTEKQLLHPHYETIMNYIYNNHQKKNDVLVIFECSNSKPYSHSYVLKTHFIDKLSDKCDFAVMSNPGVIPMEYSNYYPYRYDEWDHGQETPEIVEKYVEVNIQRTLSYVSHFGYKHVFVVMQHPHTQKLFDRMYRENIGGCRDWMTIVTNDEFRERYHQEYFPIFKHEGLSIARMMNSKLLREHFKQVLYEYLKKTE